MDASYLLNTLLQDTNSLWIIWKSDLSYIDFNVYMKNTVDKTVNPLDKTFLKRLFGEFEDIYEAVWKLNKEKKFHVIKMTNGTEHHILFQTMVLEKTGNTSTFLSVGTDMTEVVILRQALINKKQMLTDMEERYNLSLEEADLGIMIFDLEGFLVYISENSRGLLGIDKKYDISIMDIHLQIHLDERDGNLFQLSQLLKGTIEIFASEYRLLVNNIYRHFSFKFKNVRDEKGNILRVTVVFFDITAQKEMDELINKRTFEDELTDLPNRRKFLIDGERIIETTNQKISLIYFDLDSFQIMNNLHGYGYGDEILKNVAKVISEILEENTLFARLGGDDFVILITGKNEMEIEEFVIQLNEAIVKMETSNQKDVISISVGISLSVNKRDIATLLAEATMAVGVAKTDQNKFYRFYDEATKNLAIEKEILKKELLVAYEKKQFTIYYQPKFSFAERKLAGAEALIRWVHPKKGLVPPNLFIPVAEGMGLITKIDEWVMREVCRQNKQWQDLGIPPIKISVNISQAQFYHTDILATIQSTLKETDLSAEYLEIELTETMAMQNIQTTVETLEKIKELGVSVSMDDFGTGYSSLNSLKILPLDTLKIDRSLIIDVETNELSREIVRSIINLAKIMKLKTVAEGIETDEQSNSLKQIGCDLAQGYYYGKPESSEKFLSFYSNI